MAHQQRNSTSEQISQQWAGRMHRLLKDDIIMRPPPTVQEVLNAMGAVRREGQQVTKQNVRKAILFSRNLKLQNRRSTVPQQISDQWARRMHRLLEDETRMNPESTFQEVLNAMRVVRSEGKQVTKQNVRDEILFSRSLKSLFDREPSPSLQSMIPVVTQQHLRRVRQNLPLHRVSVQHWNRAQTVGDLYKPPRKIQQQQLPPLGSLPIISQDMIQVLRRPPVLDQGKQERSRQSNKQNQGKRR